MPRSLAVILSGDASPLVGAYARAEAATRQWQATTEKASTAHDSAMGRAGKRATQSAAEITAAFKSQEQVTARANGRLVARLTAEENAMSKAAIAASKYGKATSFINDHRNQLSTVSRGMAGFGIAAVGAFGLAVKSAADFGKSMSEVAATGEDARSQFGALRKAAIKAGADTQFSATQSADAITALAKAGVAATDILGKGGKGGLSGALDLAAAGQIDVASAAEIAATAMTQFNLQGKDVPHIADLLAAGAGKAQGEVGDLAYALQQSGLVASDFGLSVDDTVGTLSAFASAGLLGSDAGTSFKNMLLRLANPSKQAQKIMEDLGVSVYDANGQFVGMQSLAGQLKAKMGDLTQAQRNQKLATIFGSDAIRAANVLFDQGADGIQGWIDKTNDAGYAAEVAKIKMNNLNGDLEKLKGSFETALIGAGEGQQGPLRQMVQALDGVIDKWNDLSDDAKSNIGRIVGALGFLSLGGAAIIKAVQGVSAVRGALTDLGLAGGPISALKELRSNADKAGAALTTMGKAGRITQVGLPLVGLALVGVVTAISYFAEQSAKAKERAEDFAAAMMTIEGSVNRATAAFNDGVRSNAIQQLQEAGADTAARKIGISFDLVTEAALHNQDAMAAVAKAIDAARQSGDKYDARTGVTTMSAEHKAADELSRAIFGTSKAIDTQIQKEKERRSAMDAGTDAQKKQKAAVDDAKSSISAAGGTVQGLNDQEILLQGTSTKLTGAQNDLAKAVEKLRNQFTILKNGALDADEATDAWKGSLDDLAKSVKENGTTLDNNTDKGRTNKNAIRDSIKAMNDKITADFKAESQTKGVTRATADASKKLQQQKDDLVEAAVKAGYNRREVKKMVDQMVLTPTELKTQVKAFGIDDLKKKIKDLQDQINELKGDHEIKLNYRVLAQDKSIPIKLDNMSPVGAHATGGLITGPGTGTSDSILSWLSNKEFVHTAKSVDYYGVGFMDAINRRLIPREVLPGFRSGGLVNNGTANTGGNGVAGAPVVPQITLAGDIASGAVNAIIGLVQNATNAVNQSAVDYLRQAVSGGVRMGSDNVVSWHGGRFTDNFANHLQLVFDEQPFQVYQGGWNAGGVAASGSTHDKDAIDAGPNFDSLAALFRGVGIPAWHRTPSQGPWMDHVHGVPSPNVGIASPAAHNQYLDFLRGGNGLGGADDGPAAAGLSDPGGLVASGGVSGSVQSQVRSLMLRFWGAGEWPALKTLVQNESSWNPRALNASSGAYGLFQALPASKIDWYGPRDSIYAQAMFGLNYIDDRYHTPTNAYRAWLARTPHWYANGGFVSGPGGPREDKIPAMLSNGEFVMNAAATGAFRPLLEMINSGVARFATGGPVGAATFGSSDRFSVAAIVRLIRELSNPIAELRKFTASVKAASAANKAAARSLIKPRENLTDTTRRYNRAVDARDAARLANARKTNTQRGAVADASDDLQAAKLGLQELKPASDKASRAQSTLNSAISSRDSKDRANAEQIAKYNDKITKAKKGSLAYQNLINAKELAQKANAREMADANEKVRKARAAASKAGVNTGRVEAAQARVAKAQLALDRARDRQSSTSRNNTLSLAEANAAVTKASKAKKTAQDQYDKVLERSKQKSDAYKAAQYQLKQAQQALADAAKSTSDAFAAQFRTLDEGVRISDLVQKMLGGAREMAKFTDLVQRLRRYGLNEQTVQDIIDKAQSSGVAAGTSLASQILSGGKGTIKGLNDAATKLQDAADVLGYKAETGVVRKATGGYIRGAGTATSDSINARLSNGEYVINAAATARNRAVLDLINYGAGRMRFATGGYVAGGPQPVSKSDLIAAMANAKFYIQDPWGSDYKIAKVSAIVDGRVNLAIDDAIDSRG